MCKFQLNGQNVNHMCSVKCPGVLRSFVKTILFLTDGRRPKFFGVAACLGALEKRNRRIFEDYLEAGVEEFWDRTRFSLG